MLSISTKSLIYTKHPRTQRGKYPVLDEERDQPYLGEVVTQSVIDCFPEAQAQMHRQHTSLVACQIDIKHKSYQHKAIKMVRINGLVVLECTTCVTMLVEALGREPVVLL